MFPSGKIFVLTNVCQDTPVCSFIKIRIDRVIRSWAGGHVRLAILLLLAAFQSVLAQADTPSTPINSLWQAYQHAIDIDPVLAEASALDHASRAEHRQAVANLLPQFSLDGRYQQNFSSTTYDNNSIPNASNQSDSYLASLTVSQSLIDLKRWAERGAASAGAEWGEKQLSLAEQDFILRLADSYFGYLQKEEQLNAIRAEKFALVESRDRAQLAFRIGTASITDKLESEARLDVAAAEEINAINDLATARHDLKLITGTDIGHLKRLPEGAIVALKSPSSLEEVSRTAQTHNLILTMASLDLEKANHELGAVKAIRYPSLNLFAQASKQSQYISSLDAQSTSGNQVAGVSLSMPLFTSGLNTFKVQASRARAKAKSHRLNQAKRTIESDVQRKYNSLESANSMVKALARALKSSESALEATRKGLDAGIRDNADLLDAQNQYFSVRKDFIVARYNRILTLLRLKQIMGILSSEDLAEIDGYLR